MNINISFDPIRLLGLAVVAFLGGVSGNIIAALIVTAITPSLDGENLYAFGGLMLLAYSMLLIKAFVSLVVAAGAMALTKTPRSATLFSMGAGLVLGFTFTLLMGLI